MKRAITMLVVLAAAQACGTSPEMSDSDPMSMVSAPAGGAGVTASPGGSGGVAAPGNQPSAGTGGAPSDLTGGTGGMSGVVQMSADAGAPAGSGGSTGAAPDLAPYTATISVPHVASGEEGTVCIQVRLDNTMPISVIKLHNTLSTASHHFIVSKVTDPADGEQALASCLGFAAAVRGEPLSITQKKDDVIVLPDGVAYGLGASQVMSLELHYLNTASEPVDVSATTELYPAAPGAQVQDATVMLIGTAQIAIGPHTTARSGVQYAQLPDGMDGVRFFAITGHTHRFGTSVNVSSAAGPDDTGSLLYAPQPFVWDAPEMKHLEPAIEVPAGGGFNFECEWNNPSDDMLGFGESALDEMCFFWAYYYPKKPVAKGLIDGMDIGLILGGLR